VLNNTGHIEMFLNTAINLTAIKYWLLSLLLALPLLSQAQGTLLIKVRFHGDNFTVSSVKHLSQTLPGFINPQPSEQDIEYQVRNELDALLASGSVSNPTIIHGVLSDISDQQDEAHTRQTLQQGVFMLRLPYEKGMRFLKLMKPGAASQARSIGSKTSGQSFDLKPFMESPRKP